MRKTLLAAGCTLAAILIAAPAALSAPWDGGASVRSPVEQKLHDIAAAAHPDSQGKWEYICESPDEWPGLIAPEDPKNAWGGVFPTRYPTVAWLSPQSCLGIERVMAGKIGSKLCQTGEEPIYGEESVPKTYWTTVRKQVPVLKPITVTTNGVRHQMKKKVLEWKPVRVVRTHMVAQRVQTGTNPVYSTCSDWTAVLFGTQTAVHETSHLLGSGDEATAECYGMQGLAYWVWKLSGDSAFGSEAATDYWTWYQAHRVGMSYGSSECRPGGALDLDPGHPEWPSSVA